MTDKIRILHVMFTTHRSGGIQQVVLDIVTGSNASRFEHFTCALRRVQPEHDLKTLNYLPTTPVTVLRNRNQQRLLAREIAAHIRRHHIDIVQCHLVKHARILTLRARLAGARVIRTLHCTIEGRATRTGIMARIFNHFVTQYTAVSPELVDGLWKTWRVPASDIMVIPNGLDPHRFLFNQDVREKTRQTLGLSNNDIAILSLGRLSPEKDYPVLLRSAALIRKSNPSCKFFIAGMGRLESELREMISNLGLQDTVQLLGHREDAPALLSACDIFALPSNTEGLPVSLMEAMAASRPVVATSIPGCRHVVQDGKTGILVPVGNTEAIAETLLRLADDEPLRRQLGDAGRRRVVSDFSIRPMIEKYEALYERIAGHNTITP